MRFLVATVAVLSLLAYSVAYGQSAATAQSERKAGRMQAAATIAMPLAEAGDPEAQRIIGEMYFEGQGLPVSKSAAFKWNLAAANQGDRLAQYSVGYLYETGQGIAVSKENAMEYYRKSALQRYTPAQVKLGDLYRTTQDISLAIYWYEKAMELGSEEGRAKFSSLSGQRVAVANQARETANALAREEKMALQEECARMCPVATQRARCVAGVHDASACTMDDYEAVARRPSSTSVAAEIQRSLAESQRSNARISGTHQQMIAGIQAEQSQRERMEALAASSTAQRADRTADRTRADAGPKPGSNQSPTTSEREASNSTAKDRDVVESNPYEKYGASPSAWGMAINGWIVSTGGGSNRADACSVASTTQDQWVARDESTGIVKVAERTGCICGSYSTIGNMTYTSAQWKCGAYHKMRETGKKAGAIAK